MAAQDGILAGLSPQPPAHHPRQQGGRQFGQCRGCRFGAIRNPARRLVLKKLGIFLHSLERADQATVVPEDFPEQWQQAVADGIAPHPVVGIAGIRAPGSNPLILEPAFEFGFAESEKRAEKGDPMQFADRPQRIQAAEVGTAAQPQEQFFQGIVKMVRQHHGIARRHQFRPGLQAAAPGGGLDAFAGMPGAGHRQFLQDKRDPPFGAETPAPGGIGAGFGAQAMVKVDGRHRKSAPPQRQQQRRAVGTAAEPDPVAGRRRKMEIK